MSVWARVIYPTVANLHQFFIPVARTRFQPRPISIHSSPRITYPITGTKRGPFWAGSLEATFPSGYRGSIFDTHPAVKVEMNEWEFVAWPRLSIFCRRWWIFAAYLMTVISGCLLFLSRGDIGDASCQDRALILTFQQLTNCYS